MIAGGGSFDDLHRPHALTRGDVIDVPLVSESEKHRLMRYATALCQPSTNESFSIVIMEAWLLGTPALVHADCEVTRHHARVSGGGLYFSSPDDFTLVVARLCADSELCKELGQWGGEYIRRYYAWDAVLARFDAVMDDLLSAPTAQNAGNNAI